MYTALYSPLTEGLLKEGKHWGEAGDVVQGVSGVERGNEEEL